MAVSTGAVFCFKNLRRRPNGLGSRSFENDSKIKSWDDQFMSLWKLHFSTLELCIVALSESCCLSLSKCFGALQSHDEFYSLAYWEQHACHCLFFKEGKSPHLTRSAQCELLKSRNRTNAKKNVSKHFWERVVLAETTGGFCFRTTSNLRFYIMNLIISTHHNAACRVILKWPGP